MSTRERVHFIIDKLSEEQLKELMMLLQGFEIADVPNKESKAVIDDVNNGKNLVGPFSSVKELMEDLNADD